MKGFSSNHNEDFKAVALKLLAADHLVEQVADLLGVGRNTLYE